MFLTKFFVQRSITSRCIVFNISRALQHQIPLRKPSETHPLVQYNAFVYLFIDSFFSA